MRSQYVNITRARDDVKIYTDDKEELKELSEIKTEKSDTLDEKLDERELNKIEQSFILETTSEKTREMTAEEKEKLENIQKEINNLDKQRSGITGKKFIENKKPSPGSRRAGEAENQKPREKIYGQQEEKISINNEAMLQNAHGVEWMTKQLKEKMEQTEKRLNETKNLTAEQKKDIAEILNNETGKTIWTKQSLSPDCCIAAARMLSGKEKNKEDILKDFPEIQQRILKNIEKEKEFSTGFER